MASWRKPICQRGQKRAQSSIHKQVVCQPVFSQTVSREGREGGGVAIGRANPSSPSSSSSPSPPPPLPPPPPSSSSACLSIHASCCPLQRSPLSPSEGVHYKCSHNRCRRRRRCGCGKQDSGLADTEKRRDAQSMRTDADRGSDTDTVYSPLVLCGGSDWNLFRTRTTRSGGGAEERR